MLSRCMMLAAVVATAAADGTFKVGSWMMPFADENNCDRIPFTEPCDCDTVIKGGAVHIEEGYIKGSDFLKCDSCNGIDIFTEFDSTKGILYLSGDATVRTYGAALAGVSFKTTSSSTNTRTMLMNYGHGLFSRKNHHFYDYTRGSDTWIEAQAKCAEKSNDIFGLVGYLMTITSEDEQDIAVSKLTGRGWMGASDAGTEGTWRWMTGPEGCAPYDTTRTDAARSACLMEPIQHTFDGCNGAECNEGQLIGYQHSDPQSFVNAPGAYSHWAGNEPNEYHLSCPGLCTTAGEDYGHFYADGNWNDYPIVHTMDGYMCEWGGIGEMCMPKNYVSREIKLYDTCPPAGDVKVSQVPESGITKPLEGHSVTDGMLGWTFDEMQVRLTSIPRVYMQPTAKVFWPDMSDAPVPEGTAFRLTCPYNCDETPCDFYVTMYHCPPCKNFNGKLTGLLPADGWVAGSCAPRFSFVAEGHSMVAFRKQLAAGETYDLPATETELAHFAIWGNSNALDCEAQQMEGTCLSSNACAWIDGACISDWCPRIRTTPGSPPSCTECAVVDFE